MDIGVLHQNNITATLVFYIQEIAKINLIQTLYIFRLIVWVHCFHFKFFAVHKTCKHFVILNSANIFPC